MFTEFFKWTRTLVDFIINDPRINVKCDLSAEFSQAQFVLICCCSLKLQSASWSLRMKL